MLAARDRPTGFPTEESTLKAHKTDVIVACFGMGESFAGDKGLANFKAQLASLLKSHAGKKYNGHSDVRLILVSPIACEDLGKLTPTLKKRNQELKAYTQAMRDVATSANIPFVDLFEASRYLMDESVGPQLTTNGIHLNAYGYWALSQAFFKQLVTEDQFPASVSWLLRVDASSLSSDSRGVEISNVTASDSGLSFQVAEKSPPNLPPPTDSQLPPQLGMARDRLIVDNLAPGRYELTIDGVPVITADDRGWADGVPIDRSPVHKSAEEYRAMVNDKNLQFTYSWKALNQVHIVGERKQSPSGRALPAEIIEFNQLAEDLEKVLRKGLQLKTRNWRIDRLPSS